MDTISLKLEFKTTALRDKVYFGLEKTKGSEGGYLRLNTLNQMTKDIILKLSYPKYYDKSNAYIIAKREEVQEVNEDFVKEILLNLNDNEDILDIRIKLLRVDIPFTILAAEGKEFDYYARLYYVFTNIYNMKYLKSDPKAIEQFLTGKKETIILASTKKASDFHSKVTIYNQYKRLSDCHDKSKWEKHGEEQLKRRIRIEVAKKFKDKFMSLVEFVDTNLLDKHYGEYLWEIMEKMLCPQSFEQLKENNRIELTELLRKALERGDFTYRNFIYENENKILCWEPLRSAIIAVKYDKSRKTIENAITATRKALIELGEVRNREYYGINSEFYRFRNDFNDMWLKFNDELFTIVE